MNLTNQRKRNLHIQYDRIIAHKKALLYECQQWELRRPTPRRDKVISLLGLQIRCYEVRKQLLDLGTSPEDLEKQLND